MAFRIVATLLAEGVSLDQYTGRLTAFNMLEAVLAPSFPAILGKLVVVNIYEIDDGREPCWERVTVLDAEGTALAEVKAELTGEGEAHRSMVLFQGIKLAKPGIFNVVVEQARRSDGPWQSIARRRLHAQMRPHPLSRPDEKNPDAGKVTGPAAITD